MAKHRTRPTYQKYFANKTRYKNKVRKAKKRLKNSPKVLKKVLKTIVEHRSNYKKAK